MMKIVSILILSCLASCQCMSLAGQAKLRDLCKSYREINYHLFDNVQSEDIEENMREATRWYQKEVSQGSDKDLANALKLFTSMGNMNMCTLENEDTLFANNYITSSVAKLATRVNDIIAHYAREYNRKCLPVRSKILQDKYQQVRESAIQKVETISRHWEKNKQQQQHQSPAITKQQGDERGKDELLSVGSHHSDSPLSLSNIKNVVVTGFGPFHDYQTNPSWEAIKDGQLKINRPNINVITERINVSYQDADKAVSTLWKEYNPLLMIHVGLAAHESAIRIEQSARHGPFIHDDVVKFAPHKDLRHYDHDATRSLEENIMLENYSCKPCQFDCNRTCLDVDRVCDKMNRLFQNNQVVMPTRKSSDAGLYLCEYIYHKSLTTCDRTVFIHVPSDENFHLHDIRNALKFSIEFLIDEALKYVR